MEAIEEVVLYIYKKSDLVDCIVHGPDKESVEKYAKERFLDHFWTYEEEGLKFDLNCKEIGLSFKKV